MKEPMELLVDGNNHGQFSIDQFIDRYIDIAKFYVNIPVCPIDLHDHSFWLDRYNEQFRSYAHEVDECISAGEVSIIAKGIEWRVEWQDGDIWAIRPDAEWCENCDTYHLGPCSVVLDEQIDAIVAANVEYVETHTDSGNAYLECCIAECDFDDRLKAFVDANDIDLRGIEIEELSRLLINFLEPVSNHIFGSVTPRELRISEALADE
jgi:hypothetical protein